MKMSVSIKICVLSAMPVLVWTHINVETKGRLESYETSMKGKDIILRGLNNSPYSGNVVYEGSRSIRSALSYSIKRAIDGMKATSQLLNDATPIYSPALGSVTKYMKIGNYKTALLDFRSVNPTDVRKLDLPGGVRGKIGYVGDRVIKLGYNNKSGRILLKITTGIGTKREETKYIEYLKPLWKMKTSQ